MKLLVTKDKNALPAFYFTKLIVLASGGLRMNISLLKKLIASGVVYLLPLLWTSSAWAVQTHGGKEGLVSHEIGHILFILGMGYLLYRMRFLRLPGSGWVEFKIFLVLILCWNFLTFSGHWLYEYIPPSNFVKTAQGKTTAFIISDFTSAIFYLSRLDHLILVPSFVFLFLALRKWRKTP